MCMLCLFFSVLGEFQAPPIGLEYELQCFGRFQWIRMDTNILETMPRKTEENKIVSYVWTSLKQSSLLRSLVWIGL